MIELFFVLYNLNKYMNIQKKYTKQIYSYIYDNIHTDLCVYFININCLN